MRNLLGRLNSRTAPALSEIAESWQTPLSGRDRLAQISQLYRTMTRMPMVRAYWDSLDPDQKSVVHALIKAGDAGRTIEQLSSELSANAEAIRAICIGLYEQGVIAYEGTAASLPVGEKPRLFVPLELGNALQRAAHELQAGDVSDHSFAELIQTKDERELFDAASHWGVDVILGVTTREQLIAALSRAATVGSSRHALVNRLPSM